MPSKRSRRFQKALPWSKVLIRYNNLRKNTSLKKKTAESFHDVEGLLLQNRVNRRNDQRLNATRFKEDAINYNKTYATDFGQNATPRCEN